MDKNDKSIWHSESPFRLILSLIFWIGAFLTYASAFRDQPQAMFGIGCLMIGRFTSTFIHECGHAIAALACRWRVIVFVVRPIGLHVPNLSLAIIPRGFRIEARGWVASVPRSASVGTQRNLSIIVAGGAAANFLVALGAVMLSFLVLEKLNDPAVAVSQIGLGFAIQTLHAGVLALVPSRPDGWNDGDTLRALKLDDYWRNISLTWLGGLLSNNVRLRDLPDWLVLEARSLGPSSEALLRYVDTLEIGRVLDSPMVDVARARELVDAYRARHGPDGWLAACDAYLAAVWEGDGHSAKEKLSELGLAPCVLEMSLAAEAAVAARLGEGKLARAKLREMRKEVRRGSPFKNLTFRDIERQIRGVLAKRKHGRSGLSETKGCLKANGMDESVVSSA